MADATEDWENMDRDFEEQLRAVLCLDASERAQGYRKLAQQLAAEQVDQGQDSATR